MRIVSIGEILWDVFPNGEHLGGAAFNFSAHARRTSCSRSPIFSGRRFAIGIQPSQ